MNDGEASSYYRGYPELIKLIKRVHEALSLWLLWAWIGFIKINLTYLWHFSPTISRSGLEITTKSYDKETCFMRSKLFLVKGRKNNCQSSIVKYIYIYI